MAACMVRSMALLLKALAICHFIGSSTATTIKFRRHRAWCRTWLACSTHVYVDMNLLGKSSRKENE